MIRFGSCLPVASCQLPDKEPPQPPFKEVSDPLYLVSRGRLAERGIILLSESDATS